MNPSTAPGHQRRRMRPLQSRLVLLDVTAAELKDILEHEAVGTASGAAPGQFSQIAGMRVGYDPSGTPRAAGEDAQRAA